MCFGNQTQKTTTNTPTPNPAVASAANQNLNFAQNLQTNGFTPYSGTQVANFSPQQSSSFGMGGQVAGSVMPYVGQAGGLINNYANAGPQSVSPQTISQNMSPYMNAYVQQALAPQLSLQDQQFAAQNKGFDASATGAGAFGDTGWGLGKTNLTQQQDTARTGLIGNAYNAAFNTAIGAGAQDVSNNLAGQTTNANLAETALGRQLTGANTLLGQGTGATNLNNTLGAQQTAQQQAQLNALYNQWQMSQQYPFQTTQLLNQTVGAGAQAMPASTTSVQSSPDNSGWGILGSLIGTVPSMIGMGAFGGSGSAGAMSGGSNGSSGGKGGGGFFADGGMPPVGQPSVVGERGPELFVPTQPGVVIPHEVLRAAMAKRDGKGSAPASGLARALGIAA